MEEEISQGPFHSVCWENTRKKFGVIEAGNFPECETMKFKITCNKACGLRQPEPLLEATCLCRKAFCGLQMTLNKFY